MDGSVEWEGWREVGNGKDGGRWGTGKMEEGGEREEWREVGNWKNERRRGTRTSCTSCTLYMNA